jgi:hypothetical protein
MYLIAAMIIHYFCCSILVSFEPRRVKTLELAGLEVQGNPTLYEETLESDHTL